MNVLSSEEMYNLEQLLLENGGNPKKVHHVRKFEYVYLLRASKLPMKVFNYYIEYCDYNNYGKEVLISSLCKKFNITEEEVESRLNEVKKIRKYRVSMLLKK